MDAISTQELLQKIENGSHNEIIFDFDETIARLVIDWSHFHVYMKELATQYRVEKEREEMNTDGFSRYMIEKFWEEWKAGIEGVFEKTESTHLSWLKINYALVDFIKNNREKYKFHILSNNMHSTLITALKELELEDYFINIFGRNSVPRPKPFPDGIEKIIELQWGDKSNFVMIWDNPNSDIAAANTAWIASILINMYI